ncbi:MAG: hypothetical protein JNM07_02685 [Phycisphaerae bacterium]|nr:hypothetical protein [Phycisphaerae bacterium]
MLRSREFPGVELRLRSTFGRPVFGMGPGAVTALSLKDGILGQRAGILEGKVRWVEPPAQVATAGAIAFLDPDGYVIRLEV